MLSTTQPAAVVLLAGANPDALAALRPSAEMLAEFGIAVESVVVSDGLVSANRYDSACAVIAASPDAKLPAAFAAVTNLPVIRVPTETADWKGLRLLEDEAGNLPSGGDNGTFATMAIGVAGAKNAALFVVAALALEDERIRTAYEDFRVRQTDAVLNHPPLE